jgi:hypothetical protein
METYLKATCLLAWADEVAVDFKLSVKAGVVDF